MTQALVGYTGFVGQSLMRQTGFERTYNRANIFDIHGQRFDVLVCAGAPAQKWQANQHPDEDLANLSALMSDLQDVKAGLFVLVSTIDVYPKPVAVDETSHIDADGGQPYGRHRHALERFATETFPRVLVVRLPGLFGHGLRKNVVFDLLHGQNLHLTNAESVFQFYDMRRLWADITTAREAGLVLVNLATEPVSVADVALGAFGIEYPDSPAPVVRYDMRSIHAKTFGGDECYVESAESVLRGIQRFAAEEAGRSR